MTRLSTINGSASVGALISGELVDLLIESVVLPRNPVDRAAVISNILGELYAAIEWLHGTELTLSDSASAELASVRQLVAAGQEHQQRMKTSAASGAAVGDPE